MRVVQAGAAELSPPLWTCSIQYTSLVLFSELQSQEQRPVLLRQALTKTENAPLRPLQVATGDLLLREDKFEITA